jgi:hypothetical protein
MLNVDEAARSLLFVSHKHLPDVSDGSGSAARPVSVYRHPLYLASCRQHLKEVAALCR